ncbi:MAG: CNNM domain-containing protein [Puniceicoccales bacterium]|nr:CNNM domain-containing protein [Puniceicoccales bacterium]
MIVSFIASLLDGVLVGATVAEVEVLKKKSASIGKLFEYYRSNFDYVLSALLGLDTMTTSLLSILLGSLILQELGEAAVFPCSLAITVIGFVFTDILPKVMGIYHRRKLLYWSVYPMRLAVWIMFPISWLCSRVTRMFIPKNHSNEELSDESFILTARRGVAKGVLSSVEGIMLEQTLTLDDVEVSTIAKKDIFFLHSTMTIEEVFRDYPEIPYSRIPLYDKKLSRFIGIVRRRDLLKALGEDKHRMTIRRFSHKALMVPGDTKISSTLELMLQNFQQVAIIADGAGNAFGVATIEDIFEYIIGRDIREYDDVGKGIAFEACSATRENNP